MPMNSSKMVIQYADLLVKIVMQYATHLHHNLSPVSYQKTTQTSHPRGTLSGKSGKLVKILYSHHSYPKR
ncbi:hypothetical protein ACFX2I_001258 [Malus domestica]